MESFRSKLHEVLPFSLVSLTKSCSLWCGLKDLFTTLPLQLMTSQSVEGTRIFPRGLLLISSDRDDRMGPNIKTQKNPMPNF